MRSIAIFGGTFDPIHNGHIQTSLAIQSSFHFDAYFFVPCNIPILKLPSCANNQQRIDMIKLAIQNHKNLNLDLREMTRNTPSYMVDTLNSFREEYEDASITLIMGYDAFLSLPQWHEWEQIIELTNLLVMHRHGFTHQPIPKVIKMLLEIHQSTRKSKLLTSRSGVVILFDAGHYDISSSYIREELKQIDMKHMIPKEIYEYIKALGLYQ